MKDQSTINLQFTTIKTPIPDFIYEGLKEFSANANAYQPQPKILIEKLAQKHKVPPEMIYLTAGIDEAIQMFAHAYGQHAYIFTPTYSVYADVEEFGGKLTRLDSIVNHEYVIDSSAKADATLIYLANPNNPAGFATKKSVLELIKNNSQAIVAIDEAYAELADLSVINQVVNYKNMAVFRSFSKAYGMAGNRIGFIVAHPEIISVVRNKTQWANVSYLSVGAAITAMDHENYFQKIREELIRQRESLDQFLQKQGFTVIPSRINCVLIKFDSADEATKFVNYLNRNNIAVSHGNGASNIGLDKSYVRISIGTAEQMAKVREIVGGYSF